MREHLLGFLLGALDPDEHRQVESRLRDDHGLKSDIDLLRKGLEPLGFDNGHHDPPFGLAVRTCKLIDERRTQATARVAPYSGRRWGVQDLMVAAGILIAASMLFFPAVNQLRADAWRAICQNNLRQVHAAASQYSLAQQGAFPYVPLSGKMATTGAFPATLHQAGYLPDARHLVCPGCELSNKTDFRLRSVAEVEQASPQDEEQLRREMGGSYGYTFGHVENGRYQGTRNQSRPYFALASDVPGSSNHGTCGHNVLFEDGHAEFLTKPCCADNSHQDDFFENDKHVVGPGTHVNDSVIAPAWVTPVVQVEPELLENF